MPRYEFVCSCKEDEIIYVINIDMMMEHISSTEDEYIECYSN